MSMFHNVPPVPREKMERFGTLGAPLAQYLARREIKSNSIAEIGEWGIFELICQPGSGFYLRTGLQIANSLIR